MKTRRQSRTNTLTRRLSLEKLEGREVPSANLSAVSAYLVDGTDAAAPQASPVIGQRIHVKASWDEQGVAYNQSYSIRIAVDGIPLDGKIHTGWGPGGDPNVYTISETLAGWYAGPGAHTVVVQADPVNNLPESNENDNTFTFQFTPITPIDLPSKFIQPIYGTLNKTHAILNYADVDPRPNSMMDYRGGSYTYDGHDAIDDVIANFGGMDTGVPIYAAADGVVNDVTVYRFDRNYAKTGEEGNHVRIDHGNGWETISYHMAANSITVHNGDHVKQGQVIGLMASSGNSTGPHLHFNPFYRGSQVEMGFAPSVYEANPYPYAGDVPAFGFEGDVTNYIPFSDLDNQERPSPARTFALLQPGTVDAWCSTFNLGSSDTLRWVWYKPDHSIAYVDAYSPSGATHTHDWNKPRWISDFQSMAGTWQVACSVNFVEFSRTSFQMVIGSGAASLRVADSANNIVVDGRTTPLNFGNPQPLDPAPTMMLSLNNHGYNTLQLSNLVLPPGFSVVGSLPASIAIGSSANLTLRMDTAISGYKFGAVRFNTNDPDVPIFNFNVDGTVGVEAAVAGHPYLTLPDPALAYGSGQQATPLAPNATVTNTTSAALTNGTLKVELASGATANDLLAVRNQGTGPGQIGITPFGSSYFVTYGGTDFAIVTGGTVSNPLVASFTNNVTLAEVQALVRNITYYNEPFTARRYVRFTLIDGSNKSSNMAMAYVTGSGTNRAPFADAGGPFYYHAEGTSLTLDASATLDIEGDPLTFTWDVNGDGIFGDATGPNPTLTAAQLQALGLDDGPYYVNNVCVRVADGVNVPVTSPAVHLSVTNQPPSANVSISPFIVAVGTSATITCSSVTDPSAADKQAGIRFAYDFNNDGIFELGNGLYAGSVLATQANIAGSTYLTTPGTHTFHVRVIDKDNGHEDYYPTAFVQAPPTVTSVIVNGGAAQRSMVTSMEVVFSQNVTLPANPALAFQLRRQSDTALVQFTPTVSSIGQATAVTLVFTSGAVNGPSLADGRYTLTVFANQVSTNYGQLDGNGNFIGGDNYVLVGDTSNKLFRLFGDSDGNGTVNAADFLAFRGTFGSSNWTFDFNNNNTVDTADFLAFRSRFGASV